MSLYEHPVFVGEPVSIAHAVDHYEPAVKHQYYALCWRAEKTNFNRFVWVHNCLTKDEALHKLIDFYGNR